MKRFFSAILALLVTASLIATFTSCGESKFDADDILPATEIITVTPPADTSGKAETSEVEETEAQIETEEPVKVDSELQSVLEDKLESMCFNGVAIVSKKGKILCLAANGKLSSGSKKDITVDTPFAIASCSKQFTAACVMILKQDGKLSVNDKLSKFFPEYKYGKNITVKNLLTMRSGIADFLNDNPSFKKYDVKKTASEKKNRKVTLKWIFSQELKFTPDDAYDYSNSNYFLLAEIVERVSGMSFADFIKERIFKPLGMNHTDVNENMAYSPDLAVSDRDPWDLPGVPDDKAPLTIRVKGLNSGNGGLISTARDMDRWLTSLREYTVLSKSSVKEMSADYNEDSSHYGYGVKVAKNGACWHVGALDYYAAYSYTIPEKGYNFFAVTNDKLSMTCDIYTFASEIINSTK